MLGQFTLLSLLLVLFHHLRELSLDSLLEIYFLFRKLSNLILTVLSVKIRRPNTNVVVTQIDLNRTGLIRLFL